MAYKVVLQCLAHLSAPSRDFSPEIGFTDSLPTEGMIFRLRKQLDEKRPKHVVSTSTVQSVWHVDSPDGKDKLVIDSEIENYPPFVLKNVRFGDIVFTTAGAIYHITDIREYKN